MKERLEQGVYAGQGVEWSSAQLNKTAPAGNRGLTATTVKES